MTTRGIANNNPGNIRKSNIQWQGEVPGTDALFETYEKPEYGIRAIFKILSYYYNKEHLCTIQEIINKWAPPTENNSVAYVADVAARCNVPADAVITPSENFMKALVRAIIWHENGQDPYSDEVIDLAWKLANG